MCQFLVPDIVVLFHHFSHDFQLKLCAIIPGFELALPTGVAFGAPIPYQEGVKYDKDKLAQIDAQLAEEFAKLDHQLDPNYHYQPRKK